ncbi:MAG: flagellar hook-associated protein FlgK [Phycisphaerae bacterium]|nr:flagellar hook-associated protein FlgK [Phycisphaerae bacterium]
MNYGIGLTGLKAAQQAIELIGTNLANAATPGYHRQELMLMPLQLSGQGQKVSTGGVDIRGVTRSYDILLEREHLRQQPIQGQVEQELAALTSINSVLGQVEGNALAKSIGDYFGAMTQLASDPNSLAYAQNTVWTADAMTGNIRSAQTFLEQMKDQVYRQASQLIEDINVRADSIAELNGEIELSIRRGTSANLLMDQRDQAVLEVSTLTDAYVQKMADTNGQVQVQAWGTPLVLGERVMHLSVGVSSENKLGVSPEGQLTYDTEARGGELGGLFELYNEIIPAMEDRLDTLAKQVMLEVNRLHTQGVGTSGGFTDLTGIPVNTTDPISAWDWPPVEVGEVFHMRVTDDTGSTEIHTIEIMQDDTISDIADRINNLSCSAHIKASVVSGRLHMEALTDDYTFDFRPDYTLNTSARKEGFIGHGTDDPAALAYWAGDNAADTLTLDLGTAPADVLTYNIGAASRTLDQVVGDINALSNAIDPLWDAAVKVQDPSTGQWRLHLQAHQDGDLADGEVSITNVGNVVWSGDGTFIAEGEDNLEHQKGLSGLDGTGGGTFAPPIEIDGIYDGVNQEYTFTVGSVGGEVGNVNNMKIAVADGDGAFVKQIDVGHGYAEGDRIEIENGLVITIGRGQFNADETFSILARGDSDPAGFLVAAGLNTFFEGINAADMDVRQCMFDNAHNVATSLGTRDVDSRNIQRLSELGSTMLDGLDGSTIGDYHRDWVSDIGQQTLVRESRLSASEAVLKQLENQRDSVSGVDPNEQAAKMLVFERMFQSMSKFIGVQDKALQTLMDII